MSSEIIAYQRLTLDDSIHVDEMAGEAVLRGDGRISKYFAVADSEAFHELMQADGHDEFRVYSQDFFKFANANDFKWKYEGSVINFMCDIKDYFNKSDADVVYIHFR